MHKHELSELALFGGSPLFSEPLHVGWPNLLQPEATLNDIGEIFASHRFTNGGPYLQAFEAELCRQLDVPHCIAVCNGTLGLLLLLKALELTGEVIVPSFTFPATVHVLPWLGLTPVFCDIDPASHSLDPDHVARLISPRTSAILGVHLWGESCEIDALQDLADHHQLRLVFDAAHALGCSHRGRPIGNFGVAEVFSFHATKFVNSLEGGAITTHDPELAKTLRLLINFGFDASGKAILPGLNAKLNEVSAAVGLRSLQDAPALIEINRRNYACYAEGLAGLEGIRLYAFDPEETRNYQYVILKIDAEQAGLSRDRLHQLLQSEGVICRRYFSPGCHRLPPYTGSGANLPATDRLSTQVLALPTGTGITPDQIGLLCGLIRLALAHSEELKK